MTARLARPAAAVVGGVLLTLLITQVVLPAGTHHGRGVPWAIDAEGVVQGMITAVLAAGLVLLFRTSRIINFGALSLGIPGGLLSFELMRFTHCPFALAFLLGLVMSGVFGAVTELTFGRRFAKRSRLIFTIATIFISGALVQAVSPAVLNAPFLPPVQERPISALTQSGALVGHLPLPGFTFHIGHFPVPFGFPEVFSVEAALIALLLLGAMLRYSRVGVALRSVAVNSERAAMLGISTGSVTTLAWTMAGVLGGLAVLLTGITGNTGVTQQTSVAATGLLPAMTAAVLARFRSIPVALGASVILSVLTSAVSFALSDPQPVIYGGQLVVLVGGLLLQRRDLYRLATAGEGSWRLTAEERPVPRELSGLASVRATRWLGGLLFMAALVVLPLVGNAGLVSQFQSIILSGIVALSLVVLTGWAGQVSLGQYAFVAVGAVVAGGATEHAHIPFLLSVPIGTLVAATVAALIGLPALRVKGLFLAVATFALAVATSVLLFDTHLFGWLLPTSIERPKIFISFDGETPFYYLCLVAFAASLVFVRNLRGSRFGRLLIASRDNDAALQSAGVPLVKTRLLAFALSGGLAGFAGALLGFQLRTVTSTAFGADASFSLFIYVVLGGVSSLPGAMIGVAYLGLNTYFLGTGQVIQFIAQTLPVLVLYFAPGGLLAIVTSVRDAALRVVAQRRNLVVPSLFRGVDAATLESRLIPLAPPLGGGGLAALPVEARWSGRSRLHGQPGVASKDAAYSRDAGVFAAAAEHAEADPETELAGAVGGPA